MKKHMYILKALAFLLFFVVCGKLFFELGYSTFAYRWRELSTGDLHSLLRGTTITRSCTPKKNIAFSKLHKCGSSTVLNILLRYGDKNNLTFVLPPMGNYLGWPKPFEQRNIIKVPWNEYNIFTHHSRFSYEGIRAVMAPDTVFVTAMREPVALFESSFTYFDFGEKYGLKGSEGLRTFVNNISSHYSESRNIRLLNPMLFDLGMNLHDMWNDTNIDQKILSLDEKFDLVMIAEYMDESLILLKHLMCWETDDVVAFTMNKRASTSKSNITEDVVDKIRRWNHGDVQLYDHFNKSLWRRIDMIGRERMQAELDELEARREHYINKCTEGVIKNDPNVWRPSNVNVESVKLKSSAKNDSTCVGMTRTELPFTDYVRKKLLRKMRDYDAKHVSMKAKNGSIVYRRQRR